MACQVQDSDLPELSNEYVEKLVGRPVSSFTIKRATSPGDNYSSALYSLSVVVNSSDGDEEVIHAISKNFPSHPLRQQFLVKSNIFWNELCIYQNWFPALHSIANENGSLMRLPFPPLVNGYAINFGNGKENKADMYSGRVFDPFDIYILMMDMKKTHGFRMANRHLGLNYDQVSLVMAEHSKVHALSWAYKIKYGQNIIKEKFPYFYSYMSEEENATHEGISMSRPNIAYEALKDILPEDSPVLESTKIFWDKTQSVMKVAFGENIPRSNLEKYLRIKPEKDEETRKADDVPWEVIVHGDCWVNNLLFRYDEKTKKAIELVLLDFQMMRNTCPTNDLAYLFYTSTSTEFRRKHLDEMLSLYHNHFRSYCDELGVEYLPGFTLDALKRRFHLAKLIGFTMALTILPVMLRDATDMKDLDESIGSGDLSEMFGSMRGGLDANAIYTERVLGIAQDLYDEGVI